jgi:DNA-binding NarL/FixJ family response regulator
MPLRLPFRGVVRALSARHLEIERLIESGLGVCEIARWLGVSPNAVRRAKDVIDDVRTTEVMR